MVPETGVCQRFEAGITEHGRHVADLARAAALTEVVFARRHRCGRRFWRTPDGLASLCDVGDEDALALRGAESGALLVSYRTFEKSAVRVGDAIEWANRCGIDGQWLRQEPVGRPERNDVGKASVYGCFLVASVPGHSVQCLAANPGDDLVHLDAWEDFLEVIDEERSARFISSECEIDIAMALSLLRALIVATDLEGARMAIATYVSVEREAVRSAIIDAYVSRER